MRVTLLRCGLVAGPLFVAVFLLEGAFKGSGYDALRHPVSSLELGSHGWIQVANFLVAGVLTVAFAAGVWRPGFRAGAVLIGVWGVGLLGAGAFTTDPVSGFPVGTPAVAAYTTSGGLHDGFSLPAFVALGAAQVLLSRSGDRRWLTYSLLSATTYLGCFALAGAGFRQVSGLVEVGGLFQRLSVIIGWGWTVALALKLLRRS
ncbi:uncharacterized protein DUF998 [Kribbella sp. VKM Ac-2571]|uniref:DUF998 domain-containing protein n=1 Tax=Kribbella sp. VKM Ac-2571 TaxID=2512222 RepID=UPI00105BE0E2|nr:DUF998 domain-containing protein [Kribbella sp. VKM Ac-2571]TDO68191.1 uncharacterized protein DUF998 [Kribbella sp. VKM Ac-2571]